MQEQGQEQELGLQWALRQGQEQPEEQEQMQERGEGKV